MIKLGCFSNLPDPDNEGGFMDLETFVPLVHDLGLDVIDFHLGKGFRSKDSDYLHHIRSLCLRHGLPVGYVGSVGNFVGSEEVVQKRMDQARFDVGVAVALGAPLVRLFGASLPTDVPDRQTIWDQMIRNFQILADEAFEHGILLGLQNHNNGNLAATGQDVVAILDEVDRPNFTCVLDTGEWEGSIGASPLGESDPDTDIYSFIEQVAPHAASVRAKIYRVETGTESWIDYKRVIGILKTAGFNGNISIVLQNQSDTCNNIEALRLATSHLRGLLKE